LSKQSRPRKALTIRLADLANMTAIRSLGTDTFFIVLATLRLVSQLLIPFMLLVIFTGPAAAERRLEARAMTCIALQGAVRHAGSVVISTGAHSYALFVASRRYCRVGEMTVPALLQSLDRERCRVGYHCVMRDSGNE
jgi:hypothetical protein